MFHEYPAGSRFSSPPGRWTERHQYHPWAASAKHAFQWNRHRVHRLSGNKPGSGYTNIPWSIRVPVFQALAPDLLIWHMKEDGSEATRLRLIECEQWWSNALPN